MLQGICTDNTNSLVLSIGKRYFLFPNGPNHYYVSRFPNEGSHTGSFQSKHFQIKELQLDQDKVYKARLIWTQPGYRRSTEFKDYYISPRKTHGYFYHDSKLTKCGGCFPLTWFDEFEEVAIEEEESAIEAKETATEAVESVPFLEVSVQEPLNYEQLTFF